METNPRSASRDHLEWLRAETVQWQLDGTITADQARTILAQYTTSRRVTLSRLVLGLGACFIGVGLVWLVVANLDHLSPGLRLSLVAAVWLLLLVGSEAMDSRGVTPVVVGAGRTVAALATGAVFLQASDSLNRTDVVATTVGAWAVACLLHAYVTSARGPLLVALAGTVAFSVWQAAGDDWVAVDVVAALSLTGLAMLAAAALPPRHFAPFWRAVGAALTLTGFFVAVVSGDSEEFTGGWWFWLLPVIALALTVNSLIRGTRLGRAETLIGAAAVPSSLVLAVWGTGETSPLRLDDLLHALVALVLALALTAGIAVVGTVRDSRLLPALATLALVSTTTYLAFSVFGDIFSGAGLFLLLGVVLLGTGYGFDRARRRIAAEVDDSTSDTSPDTSSDTTANPTHVTEAGA